MSIHRPKRMEHNAGSTQSTTLLSIQPPKVSQPFKKKKGVIQYSGDVLDPAFDSESEVSDISEEKIAIPSFKRTNTNNVPVKKLVSRANQSTKSERRAAASVIDNYKVMSPSSDDSDSAFPISHAEGNLDHDIARVKPKRCRTAYMFFVQQNRPDIHSQNPTLKFGEVSNKVSRLWASISQEDRRKYELMASADRVRWEEERSRYVPLDSSDPPEELLIEAPKKRGRKKKERKWTKAPGAPKKALTPYIIFGRDIRTKVRESLGVTNPDFKPTDVMREISLRWAALPPEEKVIYEQAAGVEKQRYALEKQEWVLKHECEGLPINQLTPKKAKVSVMNPVYQRRKFFKVRCRGDDFFDKISMKMFSYKRLILKIQTKKEDYRQILSVTQLPDIRIRDDEDVASLPDFAELEIVYAAKSNQKKK